MVKGRTYRGPSRGILREREVLGRLIALTAEGVRNAFAQLYEITELLTIGKTLM